MNNVLTNVSQKDKKDTHTRKEFMFRQRWKSSSFFFFIVFLSFVCGAFNERETGERKKQATK